MQDQTLLKITVVTDDDTGTYQVGELDFGKTGHCEPFLKQPGNRQRLVDWLRWLANACENGEPPFSPLDGSMKKRLPPQNQSPPLNTGDVLRMELGNGIVRSWEIEGFYYGGVGEEGVIELRAMGCRRPTVSRFQEPFDEVEMFVPSDLVHCAISSGLLEVYQSNLATNESSESQSELQQRFFGQIST